MERKGNWFQRLGEKAQDRTRRFMTGRYGTDKLNTLILGTGLVLCLVSMFMLQPWLRLLLTALSYVFMGIAIFRCLSRNTYRRYQENRKYLSIRSRLKDRDHKYFRCPKCRQSIRVPRKKGKIAITCPKCKKRFVKKT